MLHKNYPSPGEVDRWIKALRDEASATACKVTRTDNPGFMPNYGARHNQDACFVKFSPRGMEPFYAYWQPANSLPAPLLVHTPGYQAAVSIHPDLVSEGYNVLHISPLGYTTPGGQDETKQRNGEWPVLHDTILTYGKEGYRKWLINCMLAVEWARKRKEVLKNRHSFFGTSQGGGAALLLGSIYKDNGVRCTASDVPFLINFPKAKDRGAYAMTAQLLQEAKNKSAAWKALGYVDVMSHLHRIKFPVLLTAGGKDEACPDDIIESLYQALDTEKSYNYFPEVTHGYTRQFIPLATAWFRLFA